MASTKRSRARKAPAARATTTSSPAPKKQGATGEVTVRAPNTRFSGVRAGVVFKDGVAKLDRKQDAAALAYLTRQGYGIDEKPKAEPAPERPVDAREVATSTVVGTPLRDAAVDPRKEDFLAPINAGEADPHGPEVVSPEIHHDGPKGIRAGEVHVDDIDRQEIEEKRLAERVLIDHEEQPVETFDENSNTGPIGMSDPGSVAAGIAGATDNQAPARSASQKAWAAWAVSQGADAAEADAATRKELIERYGGEG